MLRPTDEEMTAIEKIVYCSQFPTGRAHCTKGGLLGKYQGQLGGRGRGAQYWARAFTVVSMGSHGKDRVTGLGLGSGTQGLFLVVQYVAEVIRASGQ